MNKFMLNITASSGEYYQGDCEDLVLPISDGVYGIQAGHSPVLVAIHMGMLKFTVDGETLTSAFALDTDGDFTPDSEEAVFDGAFHESYFQSAPYFAIKIDGIEWLNSAF